MVPAARVGTHAYVNPLVALALGAAAAGEPLTATIVIASVVVAAGVALIISGEAHKVRPAVWRPVHETAFDRAAVAVEPQRYRR